MDRGASSDSDEAECTVTRQTTSSDLAFAVLQGERTSENEDGCEDVSRSITDAAASGVHEQEGANPWSLTMYQKQLDKDLPQNPSEGGSAVDCILLENLTSKFKLPCILDVKIGARSYADDASPQKQARSVAKSLSTTSHQLGFRICGMQVYSQEKGMYLCQDKYYGRALTVDTVGSALESFFALNTGKSPRDSRRGRQLVSAFLAKLETLRAVVTTLDGVRFYSSSLLLIYEGDLGEDTDTLKTPNVDARVIDFANTSQDVSRAGPDTGFIEGVESLAEWLSQLIA